MHAQWLSNFCRWLENTSLSKTLISTSWVEPNIQTIHILGVSIIMGAILMINLRLLGITRQQSIKQIFIRFVPVIWWVLPIQLISGIILIVTEPFRELPNAMFQLKMLLLIGAIFFIVVLQRTLKYDALYWEISHGRRMAGKLLGMISLLLWVGIIFAGRWISFS